MGWWPFRQGRAGSFGRQGGGNEGPSAQDQLPRKDRPLASKRIFLHQHSPGTLGTLYERIYYAYACSCSVTFVLEYLYTFVCIVHM